MYVQNHTKGKAKQSFDLACSFFALQKKGGFATPLLTMKKTSMGTNLVEKNFGFLDSQISYHLPFFF